MKDASEILARAVELHTQGEYMEAEVIYDLALQLFPDDPRSYYLLGTLYSEIEKDGVALALLLRSMDMNPTTECANNLGIVLRRVGHEDAALTAYEAALEMEPDNIEAMSNMSGYYVNQGDPDKGIEWADKTLERDPEKWEAMSHKGLCLLEKGDYENGFDVYRSRTNLRTWHQRNYAPMWDGSRVKKLVIHGEQGIGDEILFMSNYWDKIKDWADEIIIECTPRIVQLFERTFKVRCYGKEEEVPDKDIDAQVPMGHLPFFLGEPGRMTELVPDPERVGFYRAKLEEMGDGPYIGLSWKGGLKSTHQHLRNTSIEDWERFLLGTPISVQYGLAGKSAEHLGIPHWQDAIDDLDELAALIKACDLIVSVCNTTIHMAGAMNVPTYILVPSKPAWRYGMTGEKMHWYQSPKMFRQTEGWEPVFKDVRKAIQEFIRTRKVAA